MVLKKQDMHIELKSYKFKLLEKLIFQHEIKIWFGRKLYILTTFMQLAFV